MMWMAGEPGRKDNDHMTFFYFFLKEQGKVLARAGLGS